MSRETKPKPKPKFSGWAAASPLNRDTLHRTVRDDSYPAISTSLPPSSNLPANHEFSSRPFSSLFKSSNRFPPLVGNGNVSSSQSRILPHSTGEEIVPEKSHAVALNKLKHLHPLADETLIEDVLFTSGNDVEKASTFLKEMLNISDSRVGEGPRCNSAHEQCEHNEKNLLSTTTTELAADIANLTSTLEDALKDGNKEFREEDATLGKGLSDDIAANMKLILSHLRSVPVEPEWEEDDVYLSHRKDALRMMRSASHHSRAATNAFLRGDHFSAQKHSLNAREEWAAADELNAKAAKEILSVRNSEYDPWKLDLHGLHAAEAVQVLQEHLLKLERHVALNQPISPPRVKTANDITGSSSHDSFSVNNVQNADKNQATFRQRPTLLQVITGVGNHSRGQAALPSAVRSFLDENGYRFDDTRPGLITVRPKFRH